MVPQACVVDLNCAHSSDETSTARTETHARMPQRQVDATHWHIRPLKGKHNVARLAVLVRRILQLHADVLQDCSVHSHQQQQLPSPHVPTAPGASRPPSMAPQRMSRRASCQVVSSRPRKIHPSGAFHGIAVTNSVAVVITIMLFSSSSFFLIIIITIFFIVMRIIARGGGACEPAAPPALSSPPPPPPPRSASPSPLPPSPLPSGGGGRGGRGGR
mmetsp:Transcript_41660/g.85173  ORF Transcript_41660/g.85173 Transcript_41660/m.85173 type:complete len:216 (+) Transcript_41660:128-775(+)